jgi:hypothetical protein
LNGVAAIRGFEMKRLFWVTLFAALWVRPGGGLSAQLPDYPLSPLRPQGDIVAPFFDGFYRNADGSFTLSFGFLNRNTDEDVHIPLGSNNFIEPREFDGSQPTFFPHYSRGGFVGRRERGAFAITVPAEFAGRDVVWTLTHAGQTWSVPGRVTSPGYELSYSPAAAGSLAPAVRFEEGPESIGREGVYAERGTVRVGENLPISLSVRDRGERDEGAVPVNVTWQRHQGPGEVEFQPATHRIAREGWGEATTTAIFREPGEYVLRARVDNFGTSDSRFDNQCCWSNAYVAVTVRP